MLIAKNDELCLKMHVIEELELRNAHLENELRCSLAIEINLREILLDLIVVH